MTDPKFWSDDFDMDLPKVIPEAKELLGTHADLELVTYGSTTHGRLNHPCVWNHDIGSIAFFGRVTPGKPNSYYAGDHPLVKCTLYESIRDAWAHDIVIVFETQTPIWDGSKTWQHFEPLMSHVRGFRTLPDAVVEKHKQSVRLRLELVPYLLNKAIRMTA